MNMYKEEQVLRQRLRAQGGMLTIDINDQTQRETLNTLDRMAHTGQIEIVAEDTHTVTYQIRDYRQFHRGQAVLWQHAGNAIPASVVHATPTRVEILVRDAVGAVEVCQISPEELRPFDR